MTLCIAFSPQFLITYKFVPGPEERGTRETQGPVEETRENSRPYRMNDIAQEGWAQGSENLEDL